MKSKEPKFMKELHKIREELSKDWGKLPTKEILDSLHCNGRKLKSQLSQFVGKAG